jgi:hypothetical protein
MADFPHVPISEKKEKWFLLIEPLAKARLSMPNHQNSKFLRALEKEQGSGTWQSIKLNVELALKHVTDSEQIFSRSSQIRTDPDPDGVIDDMFAEARTIPYLIIKDFKNICYNRREGLDFSAEFEGKTYHIEVAYVRGPTFKTQKPVFITEMPKSPIFELGAKKLINRLKTIYTSKEKQILKHGGNASNTIIFILSDLDEMYEPWLNHDLFEGKHPLEGFVLSREIPTVLFTQGLLIKKI